MMEQTTTRLVFLIAFLAYDTFSLFSDRFSFHGGSFQGWEVPQLHNESEFCNQGIWHIHQDQEQVSEHFVSNL